MKIITNETQLSVFVSTYDRPLQRTDESELELMLSLALSIVHTAQQLDAPVTINQVYSCYKDLGSDGFTEDELALALGVLLQREKLNIVDDVIGMAPEVQAMMDRQLQECLGD